MLPSLSTSVEWSSAVCAQVDPDLFYPSYQGARTCQVAKMICAVCPLASECLAEALATPAIDDHGVWGGTTPTEREAIRKARRLGIDITGVAPDQVINLAALAAHREEFMADAEGLLPSQRVSVESIGLHEYETGVLLSADA